MIRYLVDTNILSEPNRPSPHSGVLRSLKKYHDNIATASVIWHELQYGCYRLPISRKRQRIEHYLQSLLDNELPILPYTKKAADWHAQQRASLSAIGKTPAFADGQIAAIAKTNNLILVTRNVTDFEDFSGLQIENWFDASSN